MHRTHNTTGGIATWKAAPLLLSLLALLCLSACGRTVTTQVQSSFSNVPVGTGTSPEPGTNGQPQVSPTGHSESIIAGNGVAYVGSENHRLYAFNASSGKVEWQQQLGGPVVVFTVVGGVVYVSSDAGGSTQSTTAGVYALSAANGRVLWQFHHAGADEFFVVVSGGMVFASTSAEGNHFTVFGLQAGNGHLLWQRTAASVLPGLLGASNGVVYTMQAPNFPSFATNSALSALDAASGQVLWQMSIAASDGVVGGPPVASNGMLYVATTAGALYALQPTSGSVLWHVSPSRGGGGPPPAPPGPSLLSPILANGLVYAGSTAGISAYRVTDGTLVWHYQKSVIGPFAPQPVLVSGVLYINMDGLAIALSAGNGTVLWQSPGKGELIGPMLVGSGVVISTGSALYGLKASDGSQIWQSSLTPEGGRMGGGAGAPLALGTDSAEGVVYIGTDNGMVHALRADNGGQLWQYTIPELPVPTPPALNAFITFKLGTTFTGALLAITNLGLKTALLCPPGWTDLSSLQASFPSGHNLLVDATVASAPLWYDRLKALPEVSSLQANVFAGCPLQPVNTSSPQFLPEQQAEAYLQVTFSSATAYDVAIAGIDGLGFRLAAPCYEQERARGAKPTWQSMNQDGTYTHTWSLVLATTAENSTIWLQQLHTLSGVQSVISPYTASC